MNLEEIKKRFKTTSLHVSSEWTERIAWLIAEVERLRERLPPTDAPWTLKELDDAKARIKELEEEIVEAWR